ncbi:hypothetical protein NM688_g2840 [Phlebia brevispora]|uniref:Uncharacterized protein n=1 Tax=Phlebia brevispora TaxID=194682 RepID=A0ACC1T7H4_9APHY|nr:hypothetical protein NM688_g2840 [Phlebia brevispora]
MSLHMSSTPILGKRSLEAAFLDDELTADVKHLSVSSAGRLEKSSSKRLRPAESSASKRLRPAESSAHNHSMPVQVAVPTVPAGSKPVTMTYDGNYMPDTCMDDVQPRDTGPAAAKAPQDSHERDVPAGTVAPVLAVLQENLKISRLHHDFYKSCISDMQSRLYYLEFVSERANQELIALQALLTHATQGPTQQHNI